MTNSSSFGTFSAHRRTRIGLALPSCQSMTPTCGTHAHASASRQSCPGWSASVLLCSSSAYFIAQARASRPMARCDTRTLPASTFRSTCHHVRTPPVLEVVCLVASLALLSSNTVLIFTRSFLSLQPSDRSILTCPNVFTVKERNAVIVPKKDHARIARRNSTMAF